MRLRRKVWAERYIDTYHDQYLLDAESAAESVKNVENLHVEIGSGKGGFLVGMAKKYPEFPWLGIELNEAAFALCLKNIALQEVPLTNVKILQTDGEALIDSLEEGSIHSIYLNFSDPWPKKRYHKRRLTYPRLLRKYARVLQKNGEIIFKTDNHGLFLDSVGYFKEEQWEITIDENYQLLESDVMTEYEAKFRSMNQPIYRIVAKKGANTNGIK